MEYLANLLINKDEEENKNHLRKKETQEGFRHCLINSTNLHFDGFRCEIYTVFTTLVQNLTPPG